ncbi:flagellar protein FliO/FliZ [Nocardioides ginsengisegetis]|uniref:Flagellar protein FliO/FliZ n=1 Tax=Nocardioides ginsengisegetis TaxID=661491 RepID=A0A7W3J2H9_9ACTN|nr:flagellar protein FliO/FliZ [Nocardioides ginsengisegetis]
MLELTVRLVFSLAVVVGLLLLIARFGSKRMRGHHGALVRVLHRQPLTRTTSVSVVTVGSRVLVLGTTEQQVRVLAELDPSEVAQPAVPEVVVPVAGKRRADVVEKPTLVPAKGSATAPGPLAGSVLSPDTWKQALAAATGRAS